MCDAKGGCKCSVSPDLWLIRGQRSNKLLVRAPTRKEAILKAISDGSLADWERPSVKVLAFTDSDVIDL